MSIRTILCAITAVCSLGYMAQLASAQVIVAPVVSTPVVVEPAPVVVGSTYTAGYGTYVAPTYSSLSPVVTASPVVTTSGYSTLSPVVTASPVVTTATYSTLSPVVAAAPVVSYRPMVTSYAVPYVAARPVVVSPKVYVPGEPVRNFFRAITP